MAGALNLAGLGLAASAAAQDFPVRPVRLVIGFAAGGGTDVAARTVAAALSERWGQQVVVDNRGGAGGALASELVAHAVPDGYTLLGCGIAHTLAPFLRKSLPFDTAKDFAPLTATAVFANVMVVGAARPWRTVGELIAQAKADPGKLTYGSSGVGSTLHLSMELFKSMAGIDIVHVPYKGGSPSINDVVAGNVQMTFEGTSVLLPLIQAGRLRALAVTTPKRIPQLPDVPTMVESGFPNFVSTSWTGLLAPAHTPQPIVEKLNAAINDGLKTPELKTALERLSNAPLGGTPADFTVVIKADLAKWSQIVKTLGLDKP